MLQGDFQLKKPTRKQVLVFSILGLGGLAGTVVGLAVLAFQMSAWLGMPLGAFEIFGFNEGPDQPIAFPHTVHVQDYGIDCTFCHRTVTVAAAASVPAVGFCMTCHRSVGDGLVEVEKLRQYHADSIPIDWVRVHRVPDFVHFVHEAHVNFFSGDKTVVAEVTDPSHIRLDEAGRIQPGAKIGDSLSVLPADTCVICHGDVGSMIKVNQVRALKMGDCVDCHRANSFVDEGVDGEPDRLYARTDCTTCHY